MIHMVSKASAAPQIPVFTWPKHAKATETTQSTSAWPLGTSLAHVSPWPLRQVAIIRDEVVEKQRLIDELRRQTFTAEARYGGHGTLGRVLRARNGAPASDRSVRSDARSAVRRFLVKGMERERRGHGEERLCHQHVEKGSRTGPHQSAQTRCKGSLWHFVLFKVFGSSM